MATSLTEIAEMIDVLKSDEELFSGDMVLAKHIKYGVIQTSIVLGVSWPMVFKEDDEGNIIPGESYVDAELTQKEIYLAGLHAFRLHALQEHNKFASKAVNFKTINFAVTGLTERAKEAMRVVWWCDREIEDTVKRLRTPMGASREMRGEE